MINKLSNELTKRKIYHIIKNNYIHTKKSKIKIPKFNPDLTYLLGVIAGDGSLNQTIRKKGGYHYTFRIYSRGEKYLDFLNKIFKQYFKIKGKIIKDKRKNNSYHLVIKNATLFFYFVINGSEIGKKKGILTKRAKENKKYFLNYLAGLVDADGHIQKRRIQLKQKK